MRLVGTVLAVVFGFFFVAGCAKQDEETAEGTTAKSEVRIDPEDLIGVYLPELHTSFQHIVQRNPSLVLDTTTFREQMGFAMFFFMPDGRGVFMSNRDFSLDIIFNNRLAPFSWSTRADTIIARFARKDHHHVDLNSYRSIGRVEFKFLLSGDTLTTISANQIHLMNRVFFNSAQQRQLVSNDKPLKIGGSCGMFAGDTLFIVEKEYFRDVAGGRYSDIVWSRYQQDDTPITKDQFNELEKSYSQLYDYLPADSIESYYDALKCEGKPLYAESE